VTKVILTFIVCAFLAGCANSSIWNSLTNSDAEQSPKNIDQRSPQLQVVNVIADDTNAYSQNETWQQEQQSPQYENSNGTYNSRLPTKHVGDYVQNMAQDLVANMENLTDKTPIGVTNFALIDSNLQKTNLLGYQLSESFIHEMHKFRIPVIDFKATEYIRVTDHGDFILTRDFLELTENAPIEYILTGTLTKHQGGYLVNARILGLRTKAVVASAQLLMPMNVVDALLPSEHNVVDGVKLTQGE